MGRFQSDPGMVSCLTCIPGRFQAKTQATNCTSCPMGQMSYRTESEECLTCDLGKFTRSVSFFLGCVFVLLFCVLCVVLTQCCSHTYVFSDVGSASCISCSAGRFGLGCQKCPLGYFRDADDKTLTRCVKCEEGEETTELGSASCRSVPIETHVCCACGVFVWCVVLIQCGCSFPFCTFVFSSCDLGRFGNSSDGQCADCPSGEYQDKRKSIACMECINGEIPNSGQTACERPKWKTPKDCAPYTQYLNNSDSNVFKWDCNPCPEGAYCGVWYTIDQVAARFGYWRIPWSDGGMTFVRCPFVDDCLGVLPDGDAGEDGENGEDGDEMTEDIANTTTLVTNTSELEGCRVSLSWFVLVALSCSNISFFNKTIVCQPQKINSMVQPAHFAVFAFLVGTVMSINATCVKTMQSPFEFVFLCSPFCSFFL